MTALEACFAAYDAWRGTQPQLFWTDENLYGLDETQTSALRLVEPAAMSGDLASVGSGDRDPSNKPPQSQTTNGHVPTRMFAGFTSGAEPRRATETVSIVSAAPSVPPNADGSAPYHYEGRDALPSKSARPGQGGPV